MARVRYEDAWSAVRDLEFSWAGATLVIHVSGGAQQHIELALSPEELKRLKEVLKI